MGDRREDVARHGKSWLLRSFGATSALTGVVVFVTGAVEHAETSGRAGLPGVGIGVVLLVASLSALAPIPSARAARPEHVRER